VRAAFDVAETIRELEEEMLRAANNLEFEKAALCRDQIRELKRTFEGSVDKSEAAMQRPTSYSKGKGKKRSGH
jgi:excinuclease ABC subunit B